MKIDADGVQRATVLVDSYSFSPSHLIVQANKPVELILRNVAAVAPHDFVLDSLFSEGVLSSTATRNCYFSGVTPTTGRMERLKFGRPFFYLGQTHA